MGETIDSLSPTRRFRRVDFPVFGRPAIATVPQRKKIPQALEGIKAVRERERTIEEHIAAGMTMPDWVKELLAGDRVKYIPY